MRKSDSKSFHALDMVLNLPKLLLHSLLSLCHRKRNDVELKGVYSMSNSYLFVHQIIYVSITFSFISSVYVTITPDRSQKLVRVSFIMRRKC